MMRAACSIVSLAYCFATMEKTAPAVSISKEGKSGLATLIFDQAGPYAEPLIVKDRVRASKSSLTVIKVPFL
jgi:hypothetical protein